MKKLYEYLNSNTLEIDVSIYFSGRVKNGEIDIDDINEETYYNYQYNDLPPVDLMIRTSGEVRISNFMLYSISYAELYFTDTCFPDFDEEELLGMDSSSGSGFTFCVYMDNLIAEYLDYAVDG